MDGKLSTCMFVQFVVQCFHLPSVHSTLLNAPCFGFIDLVFIHVSTHDSFMRCALRVAELLFVLVQWTVIGSIVNSKSGL